MSNLDSGRNDKRFAEVADSKSYMATDLARTYGFTRSEEAAAMDQGMVDEQHAQLMRDGYIILEDVVPEETLDAILAELQKAAEETLAKK